MEQRRSLWVQVVGLQMEQFLHLNGMSGEVLGKDARHDDRWVVGLAMGAAPFLSKNLRISEMQTCPKGHDISISERDDGDYATGWACDSCCGFSDGSTMRWHCEVCKTDKCFSCLPHPGSDISPFLTKHHVKAYAAQEVTEQRQAHDVRQSTVQLLDSSAPSEEIIEQNRELLRLLQKSRTKLEEQHRSSEEMRVQLEGTRQACDALRLQLRESAAVDHQSLDLSLISPHNATTPNSSRGYHSHSEGVHSGTHSHSPSGGGRVSSIFKANLTVAHQEASASLEQLYCSPVNQACVDSLKKAVEALVAMRAEVSATDRLEQVVTHAVKAHNDRTKLQHKRQLKQALDEMGPKLDALRKDCLIMEAARRTSHREEGGGRQVTSKVETVLAMSRSASKAFEAAFPNVQSPTVQRATKVAKRCLSPEKVTRQASAASRQASRTPGSGAKANAGNLTHRRSTSPSWSPRAAQRSHTDLLGAAANKHLQTYGVRSSVSVTPPPQRSSR